MQSLSNNLRTLIWSFLLALAIWVTAVTAADPDEVRVFPFHVPIEVIGQDPGLVISTEYPASVDVTLRAPHSVWERLNANAQSVRAILDLSGLSAGEHTLTLQIQVSERPVHIVSASPESITLTLEPLITRTLTVDLSLAGQPAIGYQTGEAHLEPRQIVIAGAQSKVQKVARARVIVSLDGIRESVEKNLPVELLDVSGQVVSGVSLSPQSVLVKLPIIQQGGYRDLAVKVVVRGQVAHGYRLDNISVFPPVITVYSSDPTLVNALPGVVETHALDLQNASDDITTRLELNLPSGVSVVGERTVLVQVGISPIESSLTLSNKEVEIVGLPAGLLPLISPSTVDVIVSGPLPLLDTLTRQDVRVYVDVTGLSAGTYQLTPKVEVLISDIRVESILPGTIEVNLIVPATFTPSP
jgi:YbbR domain-containing protein